MTPVKKTPRNKSEKAFQDYLRKARIKFAYEDERIPYFLACHYLTDWTISTKLGKIYIETKGYLRPEDKRKLVAVKKQHPELDLRIIFFSSTSTKSNKDRERWAIRNGFKYAFDIIPKDWLT